VYVDTKLTQPAVKDPRPSHPYPFPTVAYSILPTVAAYSFLRHRHRRRHSLLPPPPILTGSLSCEVES
ncbi:unnamed protein product, partial [Urochloa humidicola]